MEFSSNKISRSVRLAILATSTLGVVASPAFAEEAENDSNVERIEVTGSRIARTELSQPTPVVSLESEQLAQFGNVDLGTILAELPAISATSTLVGNNDRNDNAGVSSANLRSLGASRTLVLVNGKRHVAGTPGSAQVDLTTIPASLIQRVEIVTGGASAVYGSDAVSGVVNVILKKDFEGFEFDASVGNSLEGVGTKDHKFSLLAGADIADGRGNVTFFANYERTREVMAPQLRQNSNWASVVNPEDTGENDGIPDRFYVQNVMSEYYGPTGTIRDSGGIWTFKEDGTPVRQPVREYSNNGAFGSFPNGCEYCLDLESYKNYVPGVERVVLGSTFNFDITEDVRFFSDFKFVTSEVSQQFQPSFRSNTVINVADNAFLDEDLRQSLLAEGRTTVGLNKFFDELGNRAADNTRDLYRFVAGFDGGFTLSETDFQYEFFYVYGETRNDRKTVNDLIKGNYLAAIDSVIDPETGKAVCRSQLESAQGDGYKDPATVNPSQCVAYNPFGLGQASQEARDFISGDVTREDKITQQVIGATLITDSSEFFELPAGPVDVVFGWEYREETSETITDSFAKAGFLTTAATPDSYGEYDVTEYFVEVNLPLLEGKPFVEELSLDGAYRGADYSHSGNTDAWKVGFFYAPTDQLKIRGTFGEAVRAPNIGEAFSPQSPGFATINDPCDINNIGDDEHRKANCAALGIPAGFDANDSASVDVISGGNPNLVPEESTSKTLGLVWTPEFVDDLSITLDYYDIEIEDAISYISAQKVLNNCVDAAGGPDAGYCSQVDRDPSTHDVKLVRSGYLNSASFNTRGLEFQARYGMELYGGDLNFYLVGNKLLELEYFEFQNRPDEIDDDKGEVGNPEIQFRLTTTYSRDDWTATWTTRYVDNSALYDVSPEGDTPEDIHPHSIGTMITHDLNGTYDVTDSISLRAGVRNIFDKLPPGYTSDPIYDLVGRRFYAGVNFAF